MQGPGRPDIVNAGSGETGYSECRVRGDRYSECRVRGTGDIVMQGPGGPDIVNAGSGESRYIVNAGSGGRADII
ncbi:unnamed protein product [Staurois parvus]|uniref:Uncharacterized protein n=1 Tax=Staurois parvus TaxID=386267 RepID=A0ABN9BLN9_9NEOB|nr:unnamed protein product [Staurois parvus]